jgi:hypothetical protein
MGIYRDDFTNFTFNGINSKDMKVWITNEGELTDILGVKTDDSFITPTLGSGRIFNGSTITSRDITFTCAAIDVDDYDKTKIAGWLDGRQSGRLSFDFDPYFYYNVKVSGGISATKIVKSYLDNIKGRYVYILTFSITFTSTDNWEKIGVPIVVRLHDDDVQKTINTMSGNNFPTEWKTLEDYKQYLTALLKRDTELRCFNHYNLPFIQNNEGFFMAGTELNAADYKYTSLQIITANNYRYTLNKDTATAKEWSKISVHDYNDTTLTTTENFTSYKYAKYLLTDDCIILTDKSELINGNNSFICCNPYNNNSYFTLTLQNDTTIQSNSVSDDSNLCNCIFDNTKLFDYSNLKNFTKHYNLNYNSEFGTLTNNGVFLAYYIETDGAIVDNDKDTYEYGQFSIPSGNTHVYKVTKSNISLDNIHWIDSGNTDYYYYIIHLETDKEPVMQNNSLVVFSCYNKESTNNFIQDAYNLMNDSNSVSNIENDNIEYGCGIIKNISNSNNNYKIDLIVSKDTLNKLGTPKKIIDSNSFYSSIDLSHDYISIADAHILNFTYNAMVDDNNINTYLYYITNGKEI